MQLLPLMEIRHGRVAAHPDIADPDGTSTPGQQAALWKKSAGLHVVDVDAATGGHSQWQHIHAIREHVRLQYGGGVRHMTQIQQLLDLGVDRVVLATQAIENPLWLHELTLLFEDRIVVALDEVEGRVQTNGRAGSTRMAAADLIGHLAADVDYLFQGPLDALEQVRSAAPRRLQVVIDAAHQLGRLEAADVDGAVVHGDALRLVDAA